MSDLERAAFITAEHQELVAREAAETAAAYQAVFDGTPSADDQAIVLADLEQFCGMRTALLRGTFHETGQAVGMFRVWQRIHAFRYPARRRPADAINGGRDGETRQDERPTAGGGVAERTED